MRLVAEVEVVELTEAGALVEDAELVENVELVEETELVDGGELEEGVELVEDAELAELGKVVEPEELSEVVPLDTIDVAKLDTDVAVGPTDVDADEEVEVTRVLTLELDEEAPDWQAAGLANARHVPPILLTLLKLSDLSPLITSRFDS
jgi:hypothetical protein